jgi:FAD linked oxidases, C-terminal domain
MMSLASERDLVREAGLDRRSGHRHHFLRRGRRPGGAPCRIIVGTRGDGQVRASPVEKMYGPELMQALCEFKAIWDPDGSMNPDKVIDPFPQFELADWSEPAAADQVGRWDRATATYQTFPKVGMVWTDQH